MKFTPAGHFLAYSKAHAYFPVGVVELVFCPPMTNSEKVGGAFTYTYIDSNVQCTFHFNFQLTAIFMKKSQCVFVQTHHMHAVYYVKIGQVVGTNT